jgi:hypothetical protein
MESWNLPTLKVSIKDTSRVRDSKEYFFLHDVRCLGKEWNKNKLFT